MLDYSYSHSYTFLSFGNRSGWFCYHNITIRRWCNLRNVTLEMSVEMETCDEMGMTLSRACDSMQLWVKIIYYFWSYYWFIFKNKWNCDGMLLGAVSLHLPPFLSSSELHTECYLVDSHKFSLYFSLLLWSTHVWTVVCCHQDLLKLMLVICSLCEMLETSFHIVRTLVSKRQPLNQGHWS